MVASLNISCLSVDCTKIHVEQVCCAGNIKSSCRNVIFLIVYRLVVRVACACDNKQDVVFADLVFKIAYYACQRLVKLQIGYLHVCLPVVEVFDLGFKRERQHVGYVVLAKAHAFCACFGKLGYAVVARLVACAVECF